MVAKKKGAGGNLTRSQVVTVRLDPKLKYAAELAARKQRRTISSFIEWAVEQAVERVEINQGDMNNSPDTVQDAVRWTWDVSEPDRLVKLALNIPELLSYEEEQLWKIITECNYFWKGGVAVEIPHHLSKIDYFHFENLREKWAELNQVIEGEVEVDEIKKLHAPPLPPNLKFISSSDEVPF